MRLLYVFLFSMLSQNLQARPLFDESPDQALAVTIKTDLQKIRNNRNDILESTDNFITGSLQLSDRTFDIRIHTRGYNRLANCPFPPLMIRFDKSEIKNSLFKHNYTIKMVTHCREDKLQLLFREHLINKIYNLITPYCFRVRLLKVQYIDINLKEKPIETYAFFIESTNSVKKRLALDKLTSDSDFNMKTYNNVSTGWLNDSQLELQGAFQHLIRNNDWVIFHSEPAKTLSLGNVKIFHDAIEGFPFPYDFDLAGVVKWNDQGYENRFGIENLCNNVATKKAFMNILKHKEEYIDLLDAYSYLHVEYKNKLSRYLGQFKYVDDFCLEKNFDSRFFSG